MPVQQEEVEITNSKAVDAGAAANVYSASLFVIPTSSSAHMARSQVWLVTAIAYKFSMQATSSTFALQNVMSNIACKR